MADKYYSTSAPAGGDGSSELVPVNTLVGQTWSAGNRYLLKRGDTFMRLSINASGTSAAAMIEFDDYGTGRRPVLDASVLNSDYSVVCPDQRYWSITDIDMTSSTTSGIGDGITGYHQTGTVGRGIRIKRCRLYDIKNTGLVLYGIIVGSIAAPLQDIEIEDIEIDGCGDHGSLIYGGDVRSVIFRRGVWRDCGLTSDTHGASSFAHRTSYGSTGWTDAGGGVYSRAVSAPSGTTGTVADAYQAHYNKPGTYFKLVKNTATPTTPAAGEFGFSSGTLYVNVGEAPGTGGFTLRVAYGVATGIKYEFCDFAYTNKVSVEGSNIQADDFSQITVRGSSSHHSEASGVLIHLGNGSRIDGSIFYENAGAGVDLVGADSSVVTHNTVVDNAGVQVQLTFGAINVSIKNNCLVGGTHGIRATTGSTSGVVADYNALYGSGTQESGITSTNSITSNPLLDDSYRPLLGSPLLNAGSFLADPPSYDFFGKQINSSVDIGAFQVYAARSQVTRTGAARTVASRTSAERRAQAGMP